MSIQSTGQRETHRSHPVQTSLITVCIILPAPTIASKGQVWMQRVQPVHLVSSIRATARGFSIPRVVSSTGSAMLNSFANR